MKKENLLSKAEMRNVKGGGSEGIEACINNLMPCNESIQCSSVRCATLVNPPTGHPTGKICVAS